MTLLERWAGLSVDQRREKLHKLRLVIFDCHGKLLDLLTRAEADPSLLPECDKAMDALPTRTKRNILASFAATLPDA